MSSEKATGYSFEKKRSFGSPRIELQCWWVSFQWSSCAVPWYPSWLWCETWPKMTKKAVRMAKKLPLEWENYSSCVCFFFLCLLRLNDFCIFMRKLGETYIYIYWWCRSHSFELKTLAKKKLGVSSDDTKKHILAAVLRNVSCPPPWGDAQQRQDKMVNVEVCQTHGFHVLPVGWFDC